MSLVDFYRVFYSFDNTIGIRLPTGGTKGLERELGRPVRLHVAESAEEIASFVKKYRESCHASTLGVVVSFLAEFLDIEIEPDSLGVVHCFVDRVVIEHDCDSLGIDVDRYREHVRTWLKIWENELALTPTVVYSGNRSYHIHVIFSNPILIKHEVQYNALYTHLIRLLAYTLPRREREIFLKFDRHILSIRSMHRIPYSINEKVVKKQ